MLLSNGPVHLRRNRHSPPLGLGVAHAPVHFSCFEPKIIVLTTGRHGADFGGFRFVPQSPNTAVLLVTTDVSRHTLCVSSLDTGELQASFCGPGDGRCGLDLETGGLWVSHRDTAVVADDRNHRLQEVTESVAVAVGCHGLTLPVWGL